MQTTTSLAGPGPATQPLHAAAPTPRHQPDPLHALDSAVESALGVDLRLLYGMLVPVLLIFGVIIALVVSPSYWLVGATVILEVAGLAFVVVKVMAMLDEPDSGDDRL